MGSVGVISKAGGARPVYTPGAGVSFMMGGGESETEPRQFPGVNPQGVAGLESHPVTNRMQAAQITTPVLDVGGNQIIDAVTGKPKVENHGTFAGDVPAAAAVNEMNRRKLKDGKTRASGVGADTYQRGRLNPMRYLSGQDTGQSAGQVAFNRGSKLGQAGANIGRGIGAGIGVLAGAVSLANAGAQGQDAITGGMNAAQMGSIGYQQAKKPLEQGLGNAGATLAGRSVGVVKPQVAKPTPQVADPTTTKKPFKQTVTREGLEGELGRKEKTLDNAMFPENLTSMGERVGVLQQRLAPNTSVEPTAEHPSGNFNPTVAPGSMDMFTPPQYTGTVPGSGRVELTGDKTVQQGLPGMNTNTPLPTAPATTVADPSPTTSGEAIGDATTNFQQQQLTGVTAPKGSGAIIADATNPAAKAMSGNENPSMANNGIGNGKDGITNMLVGVSGSKRMVGVY